MKKFGVEDLGRVICEIQIKFDFATLEIVNKSPLKSSHLNNFHIFHHQRKTGVNAWFSSVPYPTASCAAIKLNPVKVL